MAVREKAVDERAAGELAIRRYVLTSYYIVNEDKVVVRCALILAFGCRSGQLL